MNILLVDDEPSYLMLARHYLEDQGWSVTTAENGEDALGKLSAAPVDIIVSDVYMPIMDGLRFHKALRAIPEYATIPFLFVSAFDDNHTLSLVSVSRHDGFLRKGRSPAEMKAWILYLTTPEEKRGAPPSSGPAEASRPSQARPYSRSDRTSRRPDGRS